MAFNIKVKKSGIETPLAFKEEVRMKSEEVRKKFNIKNLSKFFNYSLLHQTAEYFFSVIASKTKFCVAISAVGGKEKKGYNATRCSEYKHGLNGAVGNKTP